MPDPSTQHLVLCTLACAQAARASIDWARPSLPNWMARMLDARLDFLPRKAWMEYSMFEVPLGILVSVQCFSPVLPTSVKVVSPGSGTYTNLSQGVFSNVIE